MGFLQGLKVTEGGGTSTELLLNNVMQNNIDVGEFKAKTAFKGAKLCEGNKE